MKHITHLIGLGALLLATGCTTTPKNYAHYLPPGAQVVGGGLLIDWRAPAAGTAILAEVTTRTPVATKFIEAGDAFEFSPSEDTTVQDTFKAMFPQMPTNAQFILYFVPAKE